MNINRHNYEEYFILYMDNELSSDDRRMVEAFVQLHPDLKEELDLLQQYKLVPDESIVFDRKEELIKGDALINAANYEEWLLLYNDNELTPDQKRAVEQFIAGNPVAKKELELLQQCRLQPESIVFADKESLYRKEEKVRRIAFPWLRVAAVLIIALGITAFFMLNNRKAATDAIVNTNPVKDQIVPPTDNLTEQQSKENIVADIDDKQAPQNVVPDESNTVQQVPVVAKQQINKNTATQNPVTRPVINLQVNNSPVSNKKDEPVLIATNNEKPSNNLPQPSNNPNVKIDAANNSIANVNTPNKTIQENVLTNPAVTTKPAQPSDFANASFIEEAQQDDGKKNKLRGFFRKVTRTFEKRTNIDATDDDDRLLVAGLSIKLK